MPFTLLRFQTNDDNFIFYAFDEIIYFFRIKRTEYIEAGWLRKGQITEYTQSCLRLLFCMYFSFKNHLFLFYSNNNIKLINKSTIKSMLLKANFLKSAIKCNLQTNLTSKPTDTHTQCKVTENDHNYNHVEHSGTQRENAKKPICRSLIRPVSVKRIRWVSVNGHVRSGPHYAP